MADELYKTIEVTVSAAEENTEHLLESTREEPKHVVGLTTPQVTADVDLVVYVEREKILTIPLDSKAIIEKWIEINRDIPVGQVMEAGFVNGTDGEITYHITAWYRAAR